MSENTTRVRALYRKELREYRRNRSIVATMAITPLGIVVFPLLYVLALPGSDAGALHNGDPLVILLGIPALLPSIVAGYAVIVSRRLRLRVGRRRARYASESPTAIPARRIGN